MKATSLPAPFSIRPATAADAPQVVRIIGDVFAEYSFIFEAADEVPDLLAFASHYDHPDHELLVACLEDQVVGSIAVLRLDATTSEIKRLYLRPAQRGQGLGRALLQAALDWSRERGMQQVVLWSDTRFTLAHRLYERAGFQRNGRRSLYDVNDTEEYRYVLPLTD